MAKLQLKFGVRPSKEKRMGKIQQTGDDISQIAAIIDTNLFYYLSGLETSPVSVLTLESELNKFRDYFVSELSILEMVVRYRDQKDKFVAGINFLATNKIGVHKFAGLKEFSSKITSRLVDDEPYYKKFVSEAFEIKLQVETEFIVYWMAILIGSLSVMLLRTNPGLEPEKSTSFFKHFHALATSLKGNESHVEAEINRLLREFYVDEDGLKLRDGLYELAVNLMTVLIFDFETSTKGESVHDRKFYDESGELNIDLLFDGYMQTDIGRRVKDKSNSDQIIAADAKLKKMLLDALQVYVSSSEGQIGEPMAKYNALMIQKFLSHGNYKFKKNDVMDSLLVKYVEDFHFLTFDSGLQSAIQQIDPLNYKVCREFAAECKK